jgi:hypothetical protein
MEKITLDFRFESLSKEMGDFLVQYHAMVDSDKLDIVNNEYKYKSGDTYVRAVMPAEVATLMKLKYCDRIVKPRPIKMTVLKARNENSSFNNIYDSNILKLRYLKIDKINCSNDAYKL